MSIPTPAAQCALDNRVTLTFDRLTSESMLDERLSRALYVLIAQAVFRLERGHAHPTTHKVTDAINYHTHVSSATVGVGNTPKCRHKILPLPPVR